MFEFIDERVIPFILSLYDAVGYIGVAIAVALETIVAPIPSEVILPMAGWKVSQSAADPSIVEPLSGLGWSLFVVVAAATVGSVVGALAGYAIGAWGGRPLLDRYGRYVAIGPDDLARADRWFARWGNWAVLFGRMVPLVRTFVSYPAGIARMPLGRFIVFSTLGSIPWNFALIYAGVVLGAQYPAIERALRPYELVIYALVFLAILALVAWWIVSFRRRRAGRADASAKAVR